MKPFARKMSKTLHAPKGELVADFGKEVMKKKALNRREFVKDSLALEEFAAERIVQRKFPNS